MRGPPCDLRRGAATLLVATLAHWPVPCAAQDALEVHWTGSRLSVRAHQQPLTAVLREIQAHTGLDLRGGEGLRGTVSARLDRVSLVDGLRALLDGQNFLIVEGIPRTRVFVLGPQGGPAAGSSLGGGARSTPGALELAVTDADPVRRVEAVERLAEQSDERSLTLLRHALNDPVAAVRAVAREALDTRAKHAPPESRGQTRR